MILQSTHWDSLREVFQHRFVGWWATLRHCSFTPLKNQRLEPPVSTWNCCSTLETKTPNLKIINSSSFVGFGGLMIYLAYLFYELVGRFCASTRWHQAQRRTFTNEQVIDNLGFQPRPCKKAKENQRCSKAMSILDMMAWDRISILHCEMAASVHFCSGLKPMPNTVP